MGVLVVQRGPAMSAAATAAGYLYASGRLRGRGPNEPRKEERIPKAAIKDQAKRIARVPSRPEPGPVLQQKQSRQVTIIVKRRRYIAP